MKNRLKIIQQELKSSKLDALFISDQYNVTYLTGFTGLSPNEREAFLLITKTDCFLLTFPTYYGLYKNSRDGFSTLCISTGKQLHSLLEEIIEKQKVNNLGFEKQNLTVAELQSLPKRLRIKFISTENLIEKQRLIKQDVELNKIKSAAGITDKAFSHIIKLIKVGMTEKQLALEIEFYIKKQADDTAFPPIVAFNKYAAIPHYLPDDKKQLTDHSLILLDFGARIGNYCSDMSRVIFLNTPSSRILKMYSVVLQAQQKAIKGISPGMTGHQADNIARSFIAGKNYSPYEHGLGHGVGLAIHEDPRLKIGSQQKLVPGMVFTIEPGIYIEGTAGIRIEDLAVLTDNGVKILSSSTKEVIIL